jgi:hypothetical protein
MEPVSYSLRDVLVAQGIEVGRAGTRIRHGKVAQPVGAGAASVKGPDQKARPVYREEVVVTAQEPSSSREEARPVLHIVVDNSRNGRTQPQRVCPPGVRPFLVWSN